MNTIGASSSILAAAELGSFLQSVYRWKGEVICRLLRAGINHTYLLEIRESGSAVDQNSVDHNALQTSEPIQQFVFRLYTLNWRSKEEILAEIDLIQQLKEGGIAVSYAIPAPDGEFIQQIMAPEGLRYGLLFSYAAGEKMHRYPLKVHREAGRLMARFHQLTVGNEIARETYDLNRLLIKPFEHISRYLSAEAEEMVYLRNLSLRLQQLLKAVDPGFTGSRTTTNSGSSLLRKGVVHLDIWFENFAITADQQVILFDFDFCGNGWLALDLAFYTMQAHNSERYDAALYQPNLDAFLEGYQSILPIPAEELNLLPELGLALYIYYLGIQCQRFENWSNTFLSEDYLKRYINGLIRRYETS
jgi:Ser/Thr protein kinase RdoA (MazF antagonist)